MFRRQYDILASFLGESKQGSYQSGVDQYQFCCPSCAEENGDVPDGKYNLEVNFHIGKYHCWKCDIKGSISKLVRKYGSSGLAQEYLEDVKMLLSNMMYKIDAFEELVRVVEVEEIKLPKTFTPIGKIDELPNGKLKSFLERRCITQAMVDIYHLGYTKWENEELNIRSRIIVPSYDSKGNLNYWVGRDFTGYDKRQKYLNAKADRKSIIFNEGLIEWDGDIILVEGIIDSLVVPNCIPLMGKQLYKDSRLYEMLHKRANGSVYICLDNDTNIDETKRIYSLLNKGRLRGKVRYIRMDEYKDFGEIYEKGGKIGIINALTESKQFTDFELLV